ncbi:hypothetical protein ACOSP7_005162 [Xanthoceras sorbifolium]
MGRGVEKHSVSFICILVLVLVVSDVIYGGEARPLRGSSLIYRAKKNSGPSSGVGHRSYGNVQALGYVKNSGPGPGLGHKYDTGNKQ